MDSGGLSCGNEVSIRRSTAADIDVLMGVYADARRYMRLTGNATQWTGGYPSRAIVERDVAAGNSYVGIGADGEVLMVFSFFVGREPNYDRIEDGSWPDDGAYGTIHRLASTGRMGGMLRRCVDFCFMLADNIRLDTHADNGPMLAAVGRLGFVRCGIIYVDDGTPRVAFAKRRPAVPYSAGRM